MRSAIYLSDPQFAVAVYAKLLNYCELTAKCAQTEGRLSIFSIEIRFSTCVIRSDGRTRDRVGKHMNCRTNEAILYGKRLGLPGGGHWRELFNPDLYATGSTPRSAATTAGFTPVSCEH